MDVFRINMDNLYLHDDLTFNVGQLDGTYLFTDTGLILTFSENVGNFYMGLEMSRDAVTPPNYTWDEWREFVDRFSGCLGVADGHTMTFTHLLIPHPDPEDEFEYERDADGDVRMMSITGENEGFDPITGDLYVLDRTWNLFRRGPEAMERNRIRFAQIVAESGW